MDGVARASTRLASTGGGLWHRLLASTGHDALPHDLTPVASIQLITHSSRFTSLHLHPALSLSSINLPTISCGSSHSLSDNQQRHCPANTVKPLELVWGKQSPAGRLRLTELPPPQSQRPGYVHCANAFTKTFQKHASKKEGVVEGALMRIHLGAFHR